MTNKKLPRVAIIGAGVSGMTCARILKEKGFECTIFEKESTPGGLIRCKRVDGNLYHICGGHIFNSKRKDVLDWFWNIFDRNQEFTKADRNSVVYIDEERQIPYPIENHMYFFDEEIQKSFISDLLFLSKSANAEPTNFEDFLKQRFGLTLYQLYFKPYNEKVWRRNLSTVPLSWLEGKLPMPTVDEMIYNNMNHVEEKQFVHSTFWYEKENGSQFLANKLAEGLDIRYDAEISSIERSDSGWVVGDENYDLVIFCGNIKALPAMIGDAFIGKYEEEIKSLEYHGTTSVFCEIEKNPYSWIYLPNQSHESHRIICTGNFAESNNSGDKMTATIEFTDYITEDAIKENLKKIPYAPKYITHTYNQYTYPIQKDGTRDMIKELKNHLSQYNLYMTGRFADWEYFNMDVAMGGAMDLCHRIIERY